MDVFEFEDAPCEEDLYDKFVPTSQDVIAEFVSRLELDEAQKQDIIERSGESPNKIRFNKKVVGMYTPPENFARVCDGVYRSSFPRIENFGFLKTLKLKSIVCLIPEDYPVENVEFNESNGIQFFQIGLSGNKEPFVKIKPKLVTKALNIIMDPSNQPVLIHCNRGKHRTGCVIGCLRKTQLWSHVMIFDEYRKFAAPKERPLDQQFIEMYNEDELDE